MHPSSHHHAHVDAFLSAVFDGAGPDRLVGALDLALATLWRRTRPTLGDVTLIAVTDRVLHTTIEAFPFMWSLELVADGVRVDRLRERVAAVTPAELVAAIRFLLVELLTVLGHLTGQILTPALHAELARLAHHQTDAASVDASTTIADVPPPKDGEGRP